MSEYDEQAKKFLADHGLRFQATRIDDGTCPPFCDGTHVHGTYVHGEHYEVRLDRKGDGGRLVFDYWNPAQDVQDGIRTIEPYNPLACLNNEVLCLDGFEDFCEEFGFDMDSRKAEAGWKLWSALARKLRGFFTGEELIQLAEIQ